MARNVRKHAVKQNNALVSQVAGINNLPSLPNITARLLNTLAEPNVAVSDLADIIRLDPALSIKVMQLAQSIAKTSSQPVPDVAKAAQLVGIDSVAQLVRWSSTLDVFNTFSFCSPRDLTDFWSHSVKCALLAEGLAQELDFHDQSSAFLSGLLHDVGKLLLLTYFPTKYKPRFSKRAESEEQSGPKESLFDDDHASAGAGLVRRWQHHSLTADAILYHHHPSEAVAGAFPLVKIVFVANLLAKTDTIDQATQDCPEIRLLELSGAQIEKTVDSAVRTLEDLSASLGIDLSTEATNSTKAPAAYTEAHTVVANHVRDTSLLGTLAHSLLYADDDTDVLRLIEQALHAHFDIDRVVFLLIDGNETTLEAHGRFCDHIGDLTIPLSCTACSPVLALTQRQVLDSFATDNGSERSIMDDQIVHLMGGEGMLCLPMIVDERPVGIIVLGIDRADLANLSAQKKLLDRFSRHAAQAIRKRRLQPPPGSAGRQDTLQSVVTLTRQAVHEVNNPLGIINNYLTVLGRRLAEHDIAHDEIRIVREEITRIRNILATLAESSRKTSVSLEPVDLNGVLSDLLILMKEDLTEHRGIQVHSKLSPSVPKTLTDKDILKQAVVNLLKNSAEALPDGGNIHVETAYAPENGADHEAPNTSHDQRNGTAKLIIRDDGPGIPEHVRARLFQPFVTSKSGHEGLGLSIVHKLVEQLNGTISCDKQTNSGTQFTICLPVASS